MLSLNHLTRRLQSSCSDCWNSKPCCRTKGSSAHLGTMEGVHETWKHGDILSTSTIKEKIHKIKCLCPSTSLHLCPHLFTSLQFFMSLHVPSHLFMSLHGSLSSLQLGIHIRHQKPWYTQDDRMGPRWSASAMAKRRIDLYVHIYHVTICNIYHVCFGGIGHTVFSWSTFGRSDSPSASSCCFLDVHSLTWGHTVGLIGPWKGPILTPMHKSTPWQPQNPIPCILHTRYGWSQNVPNMCKSST